ncbi:glycosyltransferase family 2 protein [Sediminibacterium salmoneum]|uniref:glycosyltransferase family 2 protein n=1 Tax=Sediminibacterium salmoneum TaxID=426421 RepID=UPI00047DB383|nr:glycosyltransferase family 2 protein [Sediminibacterium salmoneum]
MKKVSIITVNFNHSHVTDELLDSIRARNTYENIEIIVVDNGSKENPVPVWKTKYPEVHFIRSEVNLGFAGGNNLGLHSATGDFLFFVNNDTEFTKGLIDTLVETLDHHPGVGVVSPKLLYFDQPGMLQYAGYTPMNYFTARNACIGQFETDNGQYDQLVGPTGFAHGAAMMVTREAIQKSGPMAENFFLYYEELDWADRIRRNGFDIWVNMKATIYHKESISVGKKSALKEYYMNRNRILFIRRNAPFLKAVCFYFYFLLIVTPRNLLAYIREKNYNFIKQLFNAIWWNLTNGVNSKQLGFKP